ncbi:hypothetical protein COCSADRAFT_309905 [Bipolaris sorokiniana ND90Pr]|uniref:Uncharacterized protein n=1 Tax=Cochliobolus sativus (strain ND90Pr / ATCC 201652) TaxID=665912 RepID=M2TA51_COCSN|nr:uncharacterized protein COCSADRAFT_309905 [Bipolaris sorokiniana ND90Pr]EMD65797.1 hypothetical protein COCSADRAFT_309905 [Bipolaris sorokiniana ND90Pr]
MPRLRPVATLSLHGRTILQAAIFSYPAATLEESCRLALVPLFLSIDRLSQDSSVLIESGYPRLRTRRAPTINAFLNFSPQRNTATAMNILAGCLSSTMSRFRRYLLYWLHPEHIYG